MLLSVYEALGGRHIVAAVTLVAALVLAGCGLQTPASRGPVSVRVTSDFGAHPLCAASFAHGAGKTAAELSQRACRGSGDSPGSSPGGWSLYIDGVAAGASATVNPGERVWWDRHPSSASTAAVVGAFPEPFLHGLKGRRLPTEVACASGMAATCGRVASTLVHLGVPAATQALGGGSGQDSLTVEVGTWRELRAELVAALLARGPAASGVFARFGGASGDSLILLDARGHQVATLGRAAGLVAAVTKGQAPPTWLITGTDAEGVAAAARAFNPRVLSDRFALAVRGGDYLPLPR